MSIPRKIEATGCSSMSCSVRSFSTSARCFRQALGTIREIFSADEGMPFGLTLDAFSSYALVQFQKRYARIEKARHQSLDEILGQRLDDERDTFETSDSPAS